MTNIKVLKYQDLSAEQQSWVTPVQPDKVAAAIASGQVRIVALVDGKFECPLVDNIKTSDEHTCEQTGLTGYPLQKWLRVRFGPESMVE